MATAEELLAGGVATNEVSDRQNILVIDNDLRTISIQPESRVIGVESDEDVNRLYFSMPRVYNDTDLSLFNVYINYMNANGNGDMYIVTDLQPTEDEITFSWLIGRHATEYKGEVKFVVCLKRNENGEVVQEFNTTVHKLTVLEGLEIELTEEEEGKARDVLAQLLSLIETAGTEAVNSVKSAESAAIQNIGTGVDDTLSISGKAADAKKTGNSISTLKDDLAVLNILSVGASKTNGQDQTEYFNIAISKLQEKGGGTVYVPSGTYKVSTLHLPEGINLAGDGMKNTTIRTLDATDETDAIVKILGTKNKVSDLCISCKNTNGSKLDRVGLYVCASEVTTGKRVIIENVDVDGGLTDGIYGETNANARFINVYAHHCDGIGINWNGCDSYFYMPTVYLTGMAGMHFDNNNTVIAPRTYHNNLKNASTPNPITMLSDADKYFAIVLKGNLNTINNAKIEETPSCGIAILSNWNIVDGMLNSVGNLYGNNVNGGFENVIGVAVAYGCSGNNVDLSMINDRMSKNTDGSILKYGCYLSSTAHENNININAQPTTISIRHPYDIMYDLTHFSNIVTKNHVELENQDNVLQTKTTNWLTPILNSNLSMVSTQKDTVNGKTKFTITGNYSALKTSQGAIIRLDINDAVGNDIYTKLRDGTVSNIQLTIDAQKTLDDKFALYACAYVNVSNCNSVEPRTFFFNQCAYENAKMLLIYDLTNAIAYYKENYQTVIDNGGTIRIRLGVSFNPVEPYPNGYDGNECEIIVDNIMYRNTSYLKKTLVN